MHIEDIDEDGDNDIIAGSHTPDDILLFLNNGSGSFSESTVDASFGDPEAIDTADVDGDGDIDILGAGLTPGQVAWFENDGSENFTSHIIDVSFDNVQSGHAADMDGDGDIDVVASGIGGSRDVIWYENNGSESFTASTIENNIDGRYARMVDFDVDGDMDVVAGAGDDSVIWYQNDGSKNFTKFDMNHGLSVALKFSIADMDMDGDDDVVSLSFSNDDVVWLENECLQAIEAVPENVSVVLAANEATNVASSGQKGEQTVRLKEDSVTVADVCVDFDDADVDLDLSGWNVVRDDPNFRTLMHGFSGHDGTCNQGASLSYTLYVKKNPLHNQLRVCSGKTTIGCTDSDNWSFVANDNGVITETNGGFNTSGMTVSVTTVDSQQAWKVTGLTGSSGQGEGSGEVPDLHWWAMLLVVFAAAYIVSRDSERLLGYNANHS